MHLLGRCRAFACVNTITFTDSPADTVGWVPICQAPQMWGCFLLVTVLGCLWLLGLGLGGGGGGLIPSPLKLRH